MTFPGQRLEGFEVIQEIGCGGFAKVYLAKDLHSDINVALKVIPKDLIDNARRIAAYRREIHIMKRANNPFIASYYYDFETDTEYVIVMEHLPNSNLLDYINQKQGVHDSNIRKIFAQLVIAVEYLHNELKVVHRDIKAENVLLDENNNIRLIDFGLCNILEDSNTEFATPCGSSYYTAPEILMGDHIYTSAIDIWSLGILLYAITIGNLPFDDEDTVTLCTKITTEQPYFPTDIAPSLINIMRKMLTKKPMARATIKTITADAWFPACEYEIMKSTGSVISLPLNGSIVKRMNDEFHIDCTDLESHVLGEAITRNGCVYRELARVQMIHDKCQIMAGKKVLSSRRKTGPLQEIPRVQRQRHRLSFTGTDEESNTCTGRPRPRIVARRSPNSANVLKSRTAEILKLM